MKRSHEPNVKRDALKIRAKEKSLRGDRQQKYDFQEMYNKVGECVTVDQGNLSIQAESDIMDIYPKQRVLEVIQEVKEELQLPYVLQDFQLEALQALARGYNVIIVSPTGSGKTPIIYIGIRMLEILSGRGLVALGSEPTQHIIKEKMTNPPLATGSISMKGNIQVTENQVNVKPGKTEILSGRVKVVYGYNESWSHAEGKEIIQHHASTGGIGFIFFDEGHENLPTFWGTWRKEMGMGPNEMRLQAKRPPVIVLSATLNNKNIKEVKSQFGIKKQTVVISRSPLLSNIKFVTLEKPPNNREFCNKNQKNVNFRKYEEEMDESSSTEDIGSETGTDYEHSENGDEEEERSNDWNSLLDPLLQVFLEQFCNNIEEDVEPKTGMIFSDKLSDLSNIQNYLLKRLGNKGSRNPWVLVTANTGTVTKFTMRDRSSQGEIRLYICTSVLLLGIDIIRVDIVILCRPMALLHLLLQAAGRGGRIMQDGRRRLLVCYQLWNAEDVVVGRNGLQQEVRDFCETFECIRDFLANYFDNSEYVPRDSSWCCGNCDVI